VIVVVVYAGAFDSSIIDVPLNALLDSFIEEHDRQPSAQEFATGATSTERLCCVWRGV
jgi:hypothetical protein